MFLHFCHLFFWLLKFYYADTVQVCSTERNRYTSFKPAHCCFAWYGNLAANTLAPHIQQGLVDSSVFIFGLPMHVVSSVHSWAKSLWPLTGESNVDHLQTRALVKVWVAQMISEQLVLIVNRLDARLKTWTTLTRAKLEQWKMDAGAILAAHRVSTAY